MNITIIILPMILWASLVTWNEYAFARLWLVLFAIPLFILIVLLKLTVMVGSLGDRAAHIWIEDSQ